MQWHNRAEARLLVRQLQLTNFRNYPSAKLDLPPGRLLFLGDNAQGKSNLLEAVYLLASGRSVRAGNDGEMIGWAAEADTQPFARLETAVQRRAGDVQLETIVVGPARTPEAGASRAGKRFRVNGIARRAVDFVGQLRAVLFTADDLDIISGPPAGRRQFLDSSLSQLDRAYYTALQRYGRIMQQRNATLRRIKEGIAAPDELSLWDETFSREGAVIIAARRNAVRRLAMLASNAHASLSGEAPETLELTYEPQLGDEWRPALEGLQEDAAAEDTQPIFAAALASQRRRETGAGLSLVGPHRDDLAIRLNGNSAASFGSRAQIRTTALALRLAEAELLRAAEDDPPVLLLDDIVSELDERRRDSVLAGLSGFDQVWFTATSGSWLPPGFVGAATVYDVASGSVTAR
jgi:DNA replication and repair protein RecF